MRNDIDYVDCEGEGLIYDDDWLTPSTAKGEYKYRKLNLTNSISVYYRIEGSPYLRYSIVLSFDSLGAYAPRSLPILYYGFVNMLEVWEKLGDNEENDSEIAEVATFLCSPFFAKESGEAERPAQA
jgi:hypothetical protein